LPKVELAMGWESRGGRRYFYRAGRVDGRVVKDYVGTGPLAELAAKLEAQDRRRRREATQALEAERARLAPAEAASAALDAAVDALVAAALLAAGYHRPNYAPWRRRRAARTTDAA